MVVSVATSRRKEAVVVEEHNDEEVQAKAVLFVTATSSSGIVSRRKAPAGIKETGEIFAVEVTRVKVPEFRVQNYWATKAKAQAVAKASVGENKTGGDVLKAQVITATVYEVPAEA